MLNGLISLFPAQPRDTLVLRKARSPDPGTGEEQATALTLKILQAEARRALEKM